VSWRVAASLLTLQHQLDAAYPDRSRASDGTIGDAAHQAQVSDHNPDSAGVVRALDVTHDPAHGCDIDALSDALVESRDDRISYVIANRLITGPEHGWQWTDYDGSDPHTNHLHLSVVADARADDRRPWTIGGDVALTDQQNAWLSETIEILRALAQGKEKTWSQPVKAQAQLNAMSAQVAQLAARPAAALSEDQLAAVGAAAASQAATIVGERLEEVERRLDLLIASRVAAAGAESDALTP